MKHREIIRTKLERLESNLTKMDFIMKRGGNIDDFLELNNNMKQLVEDLKAYIEQEPRTGHELNPTI